MDHAPVVPNSSSIPEETLTALKRVLDHHVWMPTPQGQWVTAIDDFRVIPYLNGTLTIYQKEHGDRLPLGIATERLQGKDTALLVTVSNRLLGEFSGNTCLSAESAAHMNMMQTPAHDPDFDQRIKTQIAAVLSAATQHVARKGTSQEGAMTLQQSTAEGLHDWIKKCGITLRHVTQKRRDDEVEFSLTPEQSEILLGSLLNPPSAALTSPAHIGHAAKREQLLLPFGNGGRG